MKKILLGFLLFLAVHCFSQENKIYSFDEVDTLPLSKRCEAKVTKEEQSKCFDMFARLHYTMKIGPKELAKYKLNPGLHNVIITFVINKKGKTEQVKVRTKNKKFREKLIRVFEFLPKVKPATLEGKPVLSYYSFRFTVKI